MPTVIVVHPRENAKKCSIEPLRNRADFFFFTFPQPVTLDLSNYVQIGIGGPELSAEDTDRGLFFLDGSWRLAERMAPFYTHIPTRSLPAIRTAYPRKSSVFPDPPQGLATIEAIYAAFRILGRSTDGLLDHYHRWKQPFLRLNGWDKTVFSSTTKTGKEPQLKGERS